MQPHFRQFTLQRIEILYMNVLIHTGSHWQLLTEQCVLQSGLYTSFTSVVLCDTQLSLQNTSRFTSAVSNLRQGFVKPSSDLPRLQLIPAQFCLSATPLLCFDCQILWFCRSCIWALCCQLPEMQEVGMAQMLAWSRNNTFSYYCSPSGPLSLEFLADSIPEGEKEPQAFSLQLL